MDMENFKSSIQIYVHISASENYNKVINKEASKHENTLVDKILSRL